MGNIIDEVKDAKGEFVIVIDGNYEGYMINHNMDGSYIKEYNILINGTRYCLTFIGLEYFTDEKIQDTGIYEYGHKPKCWVYTSYRRTHGRALETCR